MEITITGIGTPQPRASARAVGVGPAGALDVPSVPWGARTATLDAGRFTPLLTDGTHDGTIQLQGVSVASFTYGTRGAGGYRYVSATFRVRNATSGGTAYGTDRHNLTLMGVNGTGSLNATAITTLQRFDGSGAAAGLALSIVPTGWADLSGSATVTTRAPEVLQLFTEAEVAPLLPHTGITSVLPYGFVVSNSASSANRTLTANPGASQFDGLLTVAFKVPLQATAADDPFTITGLFLAVDDGEVQVTQSFEDSSATAAVAAAARATGLGAYMRSLVGTWVGTNAATFLCTVRTAGVSGTPTARLGDSITVSSLLPLAGSVITTNQTLTAGLTGAVSNASLGFASFAVNGFASGRAFIAGGYTGGGSANLSTPAGAFSPGEEVEVALTPRLLGTLAPTTRVCPYIYRYRVGTAVGSGAFANGTGSPFTVGIGPHGIAVGNVVEGGGLDIVAVNDTDAALQVLSGDGSGGFTAGTAIGTGGSLPEAVALGDVNGDGHLDAVVPAFNAITAAVLLGNGSGGFTQLTPFLVADGPSAVALGDFNGDGYLDMAVPSYYGDTVAVMLGNGAGQFTKARGGTIAVGNFPLSIAVADFNADGKLDIVVPNFGDLTVSVLLGDGKGRFSAASGSPFATDGTPYQIAVGDVNNDRIPDIVTANKSTNNVSVLLGTGSGGFTKQGTGFGAGTQPQALALGDLDGDGDLDVVVANYGSANVSVLLGNGSTTPFSFGSLASVATGNGASGVALGAFKTGSSLGIAVANLNNRSVSVLFRP
jgi:hypothetical protein